MRRLLKRLNKASYLGLKFWDWVLLIVCASVAIKVFDYTSSFARFAG